MKLEVLRLSNFRCFGPDPISISIADDVTTMVGTNGAGKSAALVALTRLFGISRSQRTVLKSDFHLGANDNALDDGSVLQIEAVFAFPELENDEQDEAGAVAEFWKQMGATENGETLKARIRLQATWVDDGTPDGSVEEDVRWITRMDENFDWEDCRNVPPAERSAVQMIYVPAARNAGEQVKSLLRGRLWRAARWSNELADTISGNMDAIQTQFTAEAPVGFIRERLQRRWSQVHSAGTDTEPVMRLVEDRFEALVRQAEIRFRPDEAGLERDLDRLSDGQKSLFQIALTAATLEVEQDAAALSPEDCPFDQSKLRRVPLTLLAIEEPENSLSPFSLSRIMTLAQEIGDMKTAQVLLASHSASILSRIEPEGIRYFRQDEATQISTVRCLTLPSKAVEANAYVRLAVRAYPELYFARFVVLAEGDSEQIVLPKVAEARGITLDRSFVPIVPLGGRHVAHFWRLLTDLDIPYATLLDLDLGRQHGGANAIRSIVTNLEAIGIDISDSQAATDGDIDPDGLADLTNEDFDVDFDDDDEEKTGEAWIIALREYGVFFSEPIDLDFSMLIQFRGVYKQPRPGGHGPSTSADTIPKRKKTTLKKDGNPALYPPDYDNDFCWYPYLFLQKSKPETHLVALARIEDDATVDLEADAPPELVDLISHISDRLDDPAK